MKRNLTSSIDLRLTAAVTAAYVLGNAAQASAPLLVAGLVSSLRWPDSQAGLAVSIEFAGLALTSVLVAPYVQLFSTRKLALAGCLAVIAMQIVCMVTDSGVAIFAARLASGFGAGIVLAVGTAVASTAHRPARTFSIMNAGAALALGALIAVGGYALERWGVVGVFGAVAIAFAALLGIVVTIPERTPAGDSRTFRSEKTNLPNKAAGALVVAGFVVFTASAGLCFAFTLDLGQKAGLTVSQTSAILGGSFLFGFAGSVVAGWMDNRFGLAKPLAVSVALVGMTWLAICTYAAPWLFVVAICLNSVAFFVANPYILSVAATLDPRGRWTAIAATAIGLSMVVAPVLGGWLLESGGHTLLGAASFAGTLISLGLLLSAFYAGARTDYPLQRSAA